MKRALFLFLILAIASCATTYMPPTAGSTSDLVLPMGESDWKLFGGFSGANVAFGILEENGCGQFYKPIEPKAGDPEIRVKIPSNKEILVKFFAFSGNWTCEVQGAFFSNDNMEYQVVKAGGGHSCSVGVLEIDLDGNKKSISLAKVKRRPFSSTVCKV